MNSTRGAMNVYRILRIAWSVLSLACVVILVVLVVLHHLRTPGVDPGPQALEVDARDLITIGIPEEAETRRTELKSYVWRDGTALSAAQPASVDASVSDPRFEDLPNLEGITRLTVVMPYGIDSIVYLFHPRTGGNRLLLYHDGHDREFLPDRRVIASFLEEGYYVAALAMPLFGMNNQPVLDLPRFGRIHLTTHDHFRLIDTPRFSSLRFFLEPIAATINYAEQHFAFNLVAMVGLSGGGWATTVYAALDERIQASYPVAGSLPIYLRTPAEMGDYEQSVPDFYRIATYEELYVLGAYGHGRRQVQVLNQYDPCCFGGVRHHAYQSAVQETLSTLGAGSFRVYLDDTHAEHVVSDAAVGVILDDLRELAQDGAGLP